MSDYIYISIKDDRLWQILFDEACIEGQQAERIQKELEQIAVDEKEIIRKPMERIVERLEEEVISLEDNYGDEVLCIPKDIVFEICKEEGGIE